MRERVTINFTHNEYRELKKEADALGEEMATYCKMLVLQNIIKKGVN